MRLPTQEHYSTRCDISHRPPFRGEEPLFYRCNLCGGVTVVHSAKGQAGKTPSLRCCQQDIEPLAVCQDPETVRTHSLAYVVFGGFEHSAIRITVDGGGHPMEEGHRIEWVYLRSYQGGQWKVLPPNVRSVVHFSLADEDAYVYCDREICRMGREHCQFECKRGMTVYAYCSHHGLMRLVLSGKGREASDS